jgi:hypothetical protein
MRRLIRAFPITLILAALASLVFSRGAHTVPLYAARTGNLCVTCHFDPNGGGPRNDYGFAFARNRHSVDAESDTTKPWSNLQITNRIGESMPIYLGLNQRFMLIANDTKAVKGLDRLAFFNMENSIHITFVPHSRLTLVYSRDAFSSGPNISRVQQVDAFGMFTGLPWNSYIKAGRFRVPFGLRLDDHTVATRNSFLDFSGGGSFLPYDPRFPDMGVEIGAEHNGWFGRAAYTNGDADFQSGDIAETGTIKIGHNLSWYQGAISFYDQYHKNSLSPGIPLASPKRNLRWGYSGMTHFGPLAALGEIAAGTDEVEPIPDTGPGPKTNLLAGFAELNYAPCRSVNFRVRYDRLELDRSNVTLTRDLNTHQRYSLEGEIVPVPFAEVRWAVRRIDHKAAIIPDETQGFLQLHLSY